MEEQETETAVRCRGMVPEHYEGTGLDGTKRIALTRMVRCPNEAAGNEQRLCVGHFVKWASVGKGAS